MPRLWDRGEPLDDLILRYTAGEDHALDNRLVPYDVKASMAHAEMLNRAGYLSSGDLTKLQQALSLIVDSHQKGEWTVSLAEEDCHTAIENRLVALTGEAGKRIHLGRSRNDQVLAALRLYLREALEQLADAAEAVAVELDEVAKKFGDWPMPGYTHMQRAMPSTVGLWAGGFAAELRDDGQGLIQAQRRAQKNPLGSAAGYGVPVLQVDREHTTRRLNFTAPHEPVTAVQLSRGKAEATALFEAALLAQDLGRLAADLCLFFTAEFAFVKLPNEFTTGSSMLPQKRNPDVFELVRGRSGQAVAALLEVFSIIAKMPSGYHRDWQLMKIPLFRGLDGVMDTCRVMVHAVPKIEFDRERLSAAMDTNMELVVQAYELVKTHGVPFRDAYQRVRGGKVMGGE